MRKKQQKVCEEIIDIYIKLKSNNRHLCSVGMYDFDVKSTAKERSILGGFGEVTHSFDTILRYFKYIYSASNGKVIDELIVNLNKKNDTISRCTFRWRRAAINCFLEKVSLQKEATPRLVYIHEYLNNIDYKKFSKKAVSPRTIRNKYLKTEDKDKILDELLDNNSNMSNLAALVLESNMRLGLRPCEWGNVLLYNSDNKIILRVKNGKNSNGRACGFYRDLDLTDMEESYIRILNNAIMLLDKEKKYKDYEKIQSGISLEIRKANNKIWPRRKRKYTLYSSRHQFAAEIKNYYLKLQGYVDPRTIAALMGHASDLTAFVHYAQSSRSNARGPKPEVTPLPIPTLECMNNVRVHGAMERIQSLRARIEEYSQSNRPSFM